MWSLGLQGEESTPSKRTIQGRISDLKSLSLDGLSEHLSLMESYGHEVEKNGITQTFLNTKKMKGLIDENDRKNFGFSACKHFMAVMHEYEKLADTSKNQDDISDSLATCFSQTLNEIENRCLLWTGEPDTAIAEKLRTCFENNGLRRK
jgi:hypothetical protein